MQINAENTFLSSVSNWMLQNKDHATHALSRSFAPLSCAMTALEGLVNAVPGFFYEKDADSETMIIHSKKDIPAAVDFLMEKAIVVNPKMKGIETTIFKLRDLYEGKLNHYVSFIEKLNQSEGTEVEFAIDIVDQSDAYYKPFYAVGSKNSYGHPLIVNNFAKADLTSPIAVYFLNYTLENQNQGAFKDLRNFAIAHEFVHIKNNDSVILNLIQGATDLISMMPWISSYSADTSWISYIAQNLFTSFAVELAGSFVKSAVQKRLETRADLGAMNLLNTNQGAIDFFRLLSNIAVEDIDYPSNEERLLAAKNWKRLESKKAA